MPTMMNRARARTGAQWILAAWVWAASLAATAAGASSTKTLPAPSYTEDILPIFKRYCFECHSHAGGKAKGGLVLDARSSFLKGGDSGPAVIPGDTEKSLLLRAVRYTQAELQMPPKGKLEEKHIALLTRWIEHGATAPDQSVDLTVNPFSSIEAAARTHWAFQPLRKPMPPAQHSPAGTPPLSPIDQFLQSRLEAAGLSVVERAEPRTLARRLHWILQGLPPEPAEVDAFAREAASGGIARWVDRWLQSPEFGETWGRYWLDVARYADSNGGGSESNNTHDDAWRFRDYIITAFNQDKPFDLFVTEQIAGDLLDATSEEQRRSQLIATGFLLLGPKAFGTSDWEQFRLDTIDEQLDTVGKSFLGLAVGCARCHDHKFDPLSAQDYYQLAGILGSTHSVERSPGWRQGRTWSHVELPIDPELAAALKERHKRRQDEAKEAPAQAEAAIAACRRKLDELKTQKPLDEKAVAQAEDALRAAESKRENAGSIAKVLPVVRPVPTAMAVRDAEKIVDEAIRIRGVPKNKGETPRRGLPSFFGAAHERFRVPENASGRLQLAHWLVDVEHGAGALLARVMANRIWGHMVGRPLVESADNFGLTGQKPTHPELLDYLAARLVEQGWSVKKLVREIALARVVQLAARNTELGTMRDPDNLLLWRHHVRRLDAEALRDGLLSVNGRLDRQRGGSTLQHQGLVSFRSDYVTLDTPSPYQRRTVYLPLLRDAIGLNQYADEAMGMLETFDFADMNLVSGRRASTTVPTQALFLMNSPWMREQAQALAERLTRNHPSAAERVRELYLWVYGRPAGAEELVQALDFLCQFRELETAVEPSKTGALDAWTSLCQALLGSNEFLFLN